MGVWLYSCILLAPLATPDPTLVRVRAYVSEWLRQLPDFVCTQTTERYHSTSSPTHTWIHDASLTTELTVENGQEHYANGGAEPLGSRGEFMSAVRTIFDESSKAVFRKGGTKTDGTRRLRRYDFRVSKQHSQWYVGPDPAVTPEYTGAVWVEESTGVVRWLFMEATRFPEHSLLQAVSLQIKLADTGGFVLPARAEIRICTNQLYCERKKIEFHDFRRFTVRSRLLP